MYSHTPHHENNEKLLPILCYTKLTSYSPEPHPYVAYLLIEQSQGDQDLEGKTPALVKGIAQAHNSVSVRAHEVHNLCRTCFHSSISYHVYKILHVCTVRIHMYTNHRNTLTTFIRDICTYLCVEFEPTSTYTVLFACTSSDK